MSDEKKEMTPYEIRQAIGKYSYLSSAQRDLLRAVFEIHDDMDEDKCKDVFRQLTDADLIPQGIADSLRKRIYEN